MIIDNCRYGTKLALYFNVDLVPIQNQNKKNAAEIEPSNGAIWNGFSEQRQHQNIKKNYQFFKVNKVQIKCIVIIILYLQHMEYVKTTGVSKCQYNMHTFFYQKSREKT